MNDIATVFVSTVYLKNITVNHKKACSNLCFLKGFRGAVPHVNRSKEIKLFAAWI
jgi:hypothetical protein